MDAPNMTPTEPRPARFNISRWALDHPALTRYLMIVLLLMGVGAYFQLGQDEDPPFTFRAMVVRTYWPGASAQQVAEQVTDKLERTLQQVQQAQQAQWPQCLLSMHLHLLLNQELLALAGIGLEPLLTDKP